MNTNIPVANLPLTIGTIASGGVGVGTVRVPGDAVTAGQLALINIVVGYTGGSVSNATRFTAP